MAADVGIVVMSVASDLATEVRGEDILFIYVAQFDLGKYQTFVFTVEFVDFDSVFSIGYEVACFLDTFGAKGKECTGVVEGDFFFPFETADAVGRGAFDGEISLVVSGADTYRVAVSDTNIAL